MCIDRSFGVLAVRSNVVDKLTRNIGCPSDVPSASREDQQVRWDFLQDLRQFAPLRNDRWTQSFVAGGLPERRMRSLDDRDSRWSSVSNRLGHCAEARCIIELDLVDLRTFRAKLLFEGSQP